MNYSPEILEVHAEFNTAADKLLEEAKEYLENHQVENVEKFKLLSELGFTHTPEFEKNQVVSIERSMADLIANTIDYYSVNYTHKFIRESDVRKICAKYGLIQGPTHKYKGFIPMKNLEEISSFKMPKEEDCAYVIRKNSWKHEDVSFIDVQTYITLSQENKNRCKLVDKKDFIICAPMDDFDLVDYEVVGDKMVKKVPDPVVLCPVRMGYLIVTAWGDESQDPLVLNEKNN